MIKIEFTRDMLAWAMAQHHETIIKGPGYQDENGNSAKAFVGFAGERLFAEFYPDAIYDNTSEYDFLLKDKRIDVKSFSSKIEPMMEYEYDFRVSRPDKGFDFYVIVNVHTSFKHGWIMGHISKDHFETGSHMIRKGEPRPNGGVYMYDSRGLYRRQLTPFKRPVVSK